MKKEKISLVIGEIEERHVNEALYYENQRHTFLGYKKTLHKTAAGIVLTIVSLLAAAGIAFAASKEFRDTVVHLFSGYTKEDRREIENGHMTGRLDKVDTLLTFLDDFNEKDMGNGEKVKYDNGYEYEFLQEDSATVNAIVACESDDYKLLVNIQCETAAEGVRVWSVVSYQIISSNYAKDMLQDFLQSSEVPEQEEIEEQKNPSASVIKAEKQHAKIYHALHKEEENIISLSKKETRKLKKIFDVYQHDESGWNGQDYNFILKFNKDAYMITEDGFVVGKRGDKTIAFYLNKKDLKKVMSFFDKYEIPR